jgi:hypothetical protein
MAGVQMPGVSMGEARRRLLMAIDEYVDESGTDT